MRTTHSIDMRSLSRQRRPDSDCIGGMTALCRRHRTLFVVPCDAVFGHGAVRCFGVAVGCHDVGNVVKWT